MRALLALAGVAVMIGTFGCGGGSTLYTVEPGGHLRKITSDPAEMFRYYVNREADFEAQGKQAPGGSKSWRDYWTKVAPYWMGADKFGTHEQVMAFIRQERKRRGLPPL